MRAIVQLPLIALLAVIGGCDFEEREQAVPARDLTLVTQGAQVEIASPVETQPLRPRHRAVRSEPAARLASVKRSDPEVQLTTTAVPVPVLAVTQPALQPATVSMPANDRELLPGKTVTVIPASSGPSTGAITPDELPEWEGRALVAGSGGRCGGRGRGPGIGIAAALRPDFR